MISYFSEVPLSPNTPTDLGFFKRLPVRRALQELGPNDPKLNMRVAESLLTISTDQFMQKWNFDPINMKPTKGRYIWTHLKNREQTASPKSQQIISPICKRVPKIEDIKEKIQESDNKLSEEAQKRLCSTTETSFKIFSPLTTLATPSKANQTSTAPKTPKSTQRKITEFGCQRKRLYSKTEEDCCTTDISPRKKLHLETPTKQSTTAAV